MDDFWPWMVVVHSWIEEFVCLFGLWADIRSLTDSPEFLSPIERPWWGPDINIQAGAELYQAQYNLGQDKPAVA